MTGPGPLTVAIVPAFNRQESVAATVRALLGIGAVGAVVVVDDGSADSTGEVAAGAGATVVRLGVNGGKGAAVASGLRA
ncbi:MAG: glycosyltransferase, partial [Acidimicrobiales bacterium]